MADRKSSKELASVASRIMEMAKSGGPIQHFEKQLQEEFGETEINTEFVRRFDNVMRPFIDDAERLAASVLSQRAK
jgi:hypothetical protein